MLYAVTERLFEEEEKFCYSGKEIPQNPDYLEFYYRKLAKTGKSWRKVINK